MEHYKFSGLQYNSQSLPRPPVARENLRSVAELPPQYQDLFTDIQFFNTIQSRLIDDILLTDESIVVSAPTGSGKTILFELAIIRLLEVCNYQEDSGLSCKIVYMAPVKALCSERQADWEERFARLGLKTIQLTGDSDEGNLLAIQHFNIVLTTPEKWDSLTRKWRDHASLVSLISLFLIDEVHLLNEDKRGSTLEAVVSRMKTVQESHPSDTSIRFIAVSATIPNIEDVAAWLGKKSKPAKFVKFGEETRPVKLRKIVRCYPFSKGMSYFRFDLTLSYKLKQIILEFSEGKPTLIFCSTRKSVVQTSTILLQNITFHFTQSQREALLEAQSLVQDAKLRDMLRYGVGFHHAGLIASDRHHVEDLFRSGFLPVLVCTSTLAMGVNLPAHLVIIKSTASYNSGSWEEYSEGHVLQMMGRAGRPQFDSTATAVILTKTALKEKYEKLLVGEEIVESSLHKNLAEHLNSEIVLGTITDIAVAVNWLRSTFFYVRALKNPKYYGIPTGLSKPELETRLQAICMRELNGLEKFELVKKTDFAYNVEPTENGKLMARLYIAFESMKAFMKIKGTENLPALLDVMCTCHEFADVQLRMNERVQLNSLNQNKERETIRYPMEGRIKTREMKVNCLIQAVLGCIPVGDPSLVQESTRIFRVAERLSKGLALYLWQKDWFAALHSALTLAKCCSARMWHDSPYQAKHLPGIGSTLASLLAAARKTTFKSIVEANPRDLERILNRYPPLGNNLIEAAKTIPEYQLELDWRDISRKLEVTVRLVNLHYVVDYSKTTCLIVGDSESNRLLRKEKFSDGSLVEHNGQYCVTINIPAGVKVILASLISECLVGVDVKKKVVLKSKEVIELPFPMHSNSYSDAVYNNYNDEPTPIQKSQNRNTVSRISSQAQKKKAERSKTQVQTSLDQFAFRGRQKLSHQPQAAGRAGSACSSEAEVTSTQDGLPGTSGQPGTSSLSYTNWSDSGISQEASTPSSVRRVHWDDTVSYYAADHKNNDSGISQTSSTKSYRGTPQNNVKPTEKSVNSVDFVSEAMEDDFMDEYFDDISLTNIEASKSSDEPRTKTLNSFVPKTSTFKPAEHSKRWAEPAGHSTLGAERSKYWVEPAEHSTLRTEQSKHLTEHSKHWSKPAEHSYRVEPAEHLKHWAEPAEHSTLRTEQSKLYAENSKHWSKPAEHSYQVKPAERSTIRAESAKQSKRWAEPTEHSTLRAEQSKPYAEPAENSKHWSAEHSYRVEPAERPTIRAEPAKHSMNWPEPAGHSQSWVKPTKMTKHYAEPSETVNCDSAMFKAINEQSCSSKFGGVNPSPSNDDQTKVSQQKIENNTYLPRNQNISINKSTINTPYQCGDIRQKTIPTLNPHLQVSTNSSKEINHYQPDCSSTHKRTYVREPLTVSPNDFISDFLPTSNRAKNPIEPELIVAPKSENNGKTDEYSTNEKESGIEKEIRLADDHIQSSQEPCHSDDITVSEKENFTTVDEVENSQTVNSKGPQILAKRVTFDPALGPEVVESATGEVTESNSKHRHEMSESSEDLDISFEESNSVNQKCSTEPADAGKIKEQKPQQPVLEMASKGENMDLAEDSSNSWLETDESFIESDGLKLTKNGLVGINKNSVPAEETGFCDIDDLFSDSPEREHENNEIANNNKENYNNTIAVREETICSGQNVMNKPMHSAPAFGQTASMSMSTYHPNIQKNFAMPKYQAVCHRKDLNKQPFQTQTISQSMAPRNLSEGEPSTEGTLLRNEYGDPFAPIHRSTATRRSTKEEKSTKPNYQNLFKPQEPVESDYFQRNQYSFSQPVTSHCGMPKSSLKDFFAVAKNTEAEKKVPKAQPMRFRVLEGKEDVEVYKKRLFQGGLFDPGRSQQGKIKMKRLEKQETRQMFPGLSGLVRKREDGWASYATALRVPEVWHQPVQYGIPGCSRQSPIYQPSAFRPAYQMPYQQFQHWAPTQPHPYHHTFSQPPEISSPDDSPPEFRPQLFRPVDRGCASPDFDTTYLNQPDDDSDEEVAALTFRSQDPYSAHALSPSPPLSGEYYENALNQWTPQL